MAAKQAGKILVRPATFTATTVNRSGMAHKEVAKTLYRDDTPPMNFVLIT